MSLPTIDTIEKLAHEQKIGKIKVLGIANTSYYRLIKVLKFYIKFYIVFNYAI